MLRNDDRCILGDVASCLLSSFLYNKTAKSAEVNVFIFRQGGLNGIHKCFNCCKNCDLINPGTFCDFVYNICFSHFLKKY